MFFGYDTLDKLLANTGSYSLPLLCFLCVAKVWCGDGGWLTVPMLAAPLLLLSLLLLLLLLSVVVVVVVLMMMMTMTMKMVMMKVIYYFLLFCRAPRSDRSLLLLQHGPKVMTSSVLSVPFFAILSQRRKCLPTHCFTSLFWLH